MAAARPRYAERPRPPTQNVVRQHAIEDEPFLYCCRGCGEPLLRFAFYGWAEVTCANCGKAQRIERAGPALVVSSERAVSDE